MAANPPVTSPAALIPGVDRFLADIRARFVPGNYGKLDDKDFLAVFELAAQVFADWRHLNVKRVKGATYPVPYTDTLGLVPPDYCVLGMQAEAVNGVDSATGAAGVTQPPVFFALMKDSTGLVDALLDAEAATTLTVKARWVQISGTDDEKTATFAPFLPEDHDYAAGDVFQYTFGSLTPPVTRLFEWRANSVGFTHPLPTGEDNDPLYKPFAPLSSQQDLSALAPRQSPVFSGQPSWQSGATAFIANDVLATQGFVLATQNTAPLFVARRDDGTQRTDFLTLRAAVFWANGNAYGGTGGYVTVNRVGPNSNALLGHGTVVDLAQQPLNLGGADLHLYAGAVIKNNRLIYNGQVVLRSGAQVGTSIEGGVVAGAIAAASDYGGVPLTLDNVIVADYGQGGFATSGAVQLVLRNGSRLLYPAGQGANVVTEAEAARLPVPPPSLYGNQLVLNVTAGGAASWAVATAVGPPVRKKQFVLIGTSLTRGWYNGVDHPASDLATLLTTKNTDTSVSFLNIGHSGWSAQDFLDNFSAYMGMVDFTVADDYYFIIDHAINDGYGNASVATTWARLQSIHQQVRAYHIKVAGTIAVTMTATTYAATDGLTHPAPGAWRAFCDGINTQIRTFGYDTSAAGLGAIAVCDVGAFPNFRYTPAGAVSASGTMQADDLHHTPIGYDQKADIELRTIKGVVANGGFGFPIPAAGTGLRLTNLTAKTDLTPAGLAGAACLTGYAVMERAAGAEGAYFVWSTNSPNPSLKTSVCYYGTAFQGTGRGEGLGSNCYDANAARTAGVIPAGVKTLVVVKLYANHPEKLGVSIAGSQAVVTPTGTQQSLAFSATLTVGGSTGTTDANLDYLQAGNLLRDFYPVVRETTFDEDLQAGALFSYDNEL